MAALKVLAFDYGCAGGPAPARPSAAQRHDGALLLQALCTDLRLLPGVELLTFDDAAPHAAGCPFEHRFTESVLAADAVWPLAPLGGGVLERLSRQVLAHGRILLGSTPDTVRTAASKRSTFAALERAAVPTVATFGLDDCLPAGTGAWVVKPDDGAGCIDTRLFQDSGAAQAWVAVQRARGLALQAMRPQSAAQSSSLQQSALLQTLVLQPFVAGRVGSISLLCHEGAARILGCNELRMAVLDNQFRFLGSTVNGLACMAPQLQALAQAVAAALPGLWGYAGVDFILAARGPLVLDVNPRLTISYAGLRASTGVNPAGAVLALLEGRWAHALPLQALPVSVEVPVFAPR